MKLLNVLKHTKKELEVEFEGDDPTLLEIVVGKLNERDDVEFAAYSWKHPLIKKQTLYVRAKEEPLKIVEEVIKEAVKELKKVAKQIE